MKTILCTAALAITMATTGATAMAHEHYYDGDRACRDRGTEVLYDRYGNRVIVARERRYVVPVEDHCRRPVVVVPEYRRVPVCEERREIHPPLFGGLRIIFGR